MCSANYAVKKLVYRKVLYIMFLAVFCSGSHVGTVLDCFRDYCLFHRLVRENN